MVTDMWWKALRCGIFLLITVGVHDASLSQTTHHNPSFPFLDTTLTRESRVNDIVSRLTLDEKVQQLLYNAPAIGRLGIPAYNWWNEALHGVARAGRATVFPQAIGLAATWDTVLMHRVASVISDEARAKYHDAIRHGRRGIYEGLTFWAPNINIFRDPRWGRGMETYGEDPYLTSRLAVEFVKGMQGDNPRYLKTAATPKHFAVHSGPEPERHRFDARVNERDLRETYLPAFRATILEAHARSVMCAYNRFRGEPCCGSNELLQTILRDEWGFEGYVVSDCWAVQDFYTSHGVASDAAEAAAMALRAGTDLNCGVSYDSLAVAVRRGLVPEALVDGALKRLFRARIDLGMFDPPEAVSYSSYAIAMNDAIEHRSLAREAAQKSVVLLKNANRVLPLRKDLHRIAVIGPNADDADVLLGNYNGIPSEPSTPLEGIRKKIGVYAEVVYERGCDIAPGVPAWTVVPPAALRPTRGESTLHGLTAEYFNNHAFAGTPVVTRIDTAVNFNWWQESPCAGIRADSFSVRWSGIVRPSVSGMYALGASVFGGFRLYLNDSLIVEYTDRHVVYTHWTRVNLDASKTYGLKLEYWDRRADAIVKLVWSPPDSGMKQRAIDAARQSDAVVAVMGLSPRLEGEEMSVDVPGFSGGDRTSLDLPEPQATLLKELAVTGPPVVLVLLNGSALAVTWAEEHVPAIIEAWYPGQAAGDAIADVLFGDVNPAGRLPVTFYRSIDQLPDFSNYDMSGRTYRYCPVQPLYQFGYGLSYTTFEYSNLHLPATTRMGDTLVASAIVTNTGSIAGEEVVQLYVADQDASVPVPIRALQGFRRIRLSPGERREVSFALAPRQLSLIDHRSRRVVEPGIFTISIGGRQPGPGSEAKPLSGEPLSGQCAIVGDTLVLDERE